MSVSRPGTADSIGSLPITRLTTPANLTPANYVGSPSAVEEFFTNCKFVYS